MRSYAASVPAAGAIAYTRPYAAAGDSSGPPSLGVDHSWDPVVASSAVSAVVEATTVRPTTSGMFVQPPGVGAGTWTYQRKRPLSSRNAATAAHSLTNTRLAPTLGGPGVPVSPSPNSLEFVQLVTPGSIEKPWT